MKRKKVGNLLSQFIHSGPNTWQFFSQLSSLIPNYLFILSYWRSTKSEANDTLEGCLPLLIDWISLWNLMLVDHHMFLRQKANLQTLLHILQVTSPVPGEKPVCTDCLPWDFWWLIYTALASKIQLHVWHLQPFTISPTLQVPKLTLKICMFNVFSFKISIIYMDSQKCDSIQTFSMSNFPSHQGLVLYSQGCFLCNPYTSSKVCAAEDCQHASDHKGNALVVFDHCGGKIIKIPWREFIFRTCDPS